MIRQKLMGALRMPGLSWSFSRLGYAHRAKGFDPADLERSLAGKQMAVSGANGGIGLAIARAWAKRDADVWMLCRNRERGERARAQLAGLGTGALHLEVVDLSSLRSIDEFLERSTLSRLDALVHNAGALVHEYQESEPGIESTFACHVVGPQRLTNGLLSALEASEDPRVVFVSSGGMYSEKLRVADLLQPPRPFDGVRAYAMAKRAQVVLTQLWAQRNEHIRFYAMHPGWVDTPGVEQALPKFYQATRRWLRSTEEGADTAVWLSMAAELSMPSGSFVFDRAQAKRHILPGTQAEETEWAALWREVERLAEQAAS